MGSTSSELHADKQARAGTGERPGRDRGLGTWLIPQPNGPANRWGCGLYPLKTKASRVLTASMVTGMVTPTLESPPPASKTTRPEKNRSCAVEKGAFGGGAPLRYRGGPHKTISSFHRRPSYFRHQVTIPVVRRTGLTPLQDRHQDLA